MKQGVTTVDRERVEGELMALMVEEFHVDPADVTDDTHLIKDLKLDSLDLMMAVTSFEDRYGIRLEDAEIQEMVTYGKAVEKLAEKLQVTV